MTDMADTTTIQITEDQHDELTARKTYDDEPIKSVVGRLLEQEPNTDAGIPDDLAEQLDRIESAAKEATNAAQNAERAAEELQR